MPITPADRQPRASLPAIIAAPLRLAAAIGRGFRAATQDGTGGRVMNSEQLWREMYGGGQITESGALVNDATVITVGEIFACLRILSSSIAMLPLNLAEYDEKSERIATGHPLQGLFSRGPNRRQTPFEFVQMMMVHKLLYGNFYALVTRSRGQVIEVWPLNPRRVQVEEQDDGSLLYKYAGPAYGGRDAQTETFYEEEILHIRGVSRDGILGESTALAAREDAGLAMRMRTYAGKLFANGARPSGLYRVPGQLSDESFARLQAALREFSSADNVGKTMILDGGAEWTKISIDADEAQMIEGRQFTRSQIAMFFGVPPQFLGDLAGSTTWGSGMAAQGKGFVTHVLMPHIRSICDSLDRALLTPEERDHYYHRIDTRALTEGDAKDRASVHDIYIKNGVMSPNEARAEIGLNPRDGGDEYAGRDQTSIAAGASTTKPASAAPANAADKPKEKPADAAS